MQTYWQKNKTQASVGESVIVIHMKWGILLPPTWAERIEEGGIAKGTGMRTRFGMFFRGAFRCLAESHTCNTLPF